MPANRSGPADPEAGRLDILLRQTTGVRESPRTIFFLGGKISAEDAAREVLGPGEGGRGGLMM